MVYPQYASRNRIHKLACPWQADRIGFLYSWLARGIQASAQTGSLLAPRSILQQNILRYSKNCLESNDEIAEMKRKFRSMSHQIEVQSSLFGAVLSRFTSEACRQSRAIPRDVLVDGQCIIDSRLHSSYRALLLMSLPWNRRYL